MNDKTFCASTKQDQIVLRDCGNKEQRYEEYKKHIASLNITVKEFEKRLRKWCKDNKY